jgi:DNA-directed RNA polymerase subunit K/omega
MNNRPHESSQVFGDLDDMLPHSSQSKFLLVNIVKKRAAQLNNGAPPLTDLVNPNKPVSTAFNEVRAGKIPFERIRDGIK